VERGQELLSLNQRIQRVLRRMRRFLRRQGVLRHKERLRGPFADWAAATAAAGDGYAAPQILERTRAAMRQVRDGTAVHERDSVLFDRIQYSWPALSGLLWAAARHGGELNVLDIGGALGSSFMQNRRFLDGLRSVRWNIVEQAAFVAVGRAEFSGDGRQFYHSVAECLAETTPQAAVLSGVLGYLPQPEALLDELAAGPCDTLILDRTAWIDGADDVIYVQRVPPQLYAADYPLRLLSRSRLLTRLARDWTIISEHESGERLKTAVAHRYGGLIALRRTDGVVQR
jgi:putative methyltransferase (TIGR04325 family)